MELEGAGAGKKWGLVGGGQCLHVVDKAYDRARDN